VTRSESGGAGRVVALSAIAATLLFLLVLLLSVLPSATTPLVAVTSFGIAMCLQVYFLHRIATRWDQLTDAGKWKISVAGVVVPVLVAFFGPAAATFVLAVLIVVALLRLWRGAPLLRALVLHDVFGGPAGGGSGGGGSRRSGGGFGGGSRPCGDGFEYGSYWGDEKVIYSDDGTPSWVGDKKVQQDADGRLTWIGDERVRYDSTGHMSWVGDDRVQYTGDKLGWVGNDRVLP
jgi:hypothetical protein